ncbi:MAG: flagellar hook-length control protein FliK [Parvularculaceae bacterium]
MSEASQISAATAALAMKAQRPAPRDERAGEDGGFSYAMASASLERQASQSLQTHGATPKGAASATAQPTQGERQGAQANADAQTPPSPDVKAGAAGQNGDLAQAGPAPANAQTAAPANSQSTIAAPPPAMIAAATAPAGAQATAVIAKPAPATAASAREQIAARLAAQQRDTAKAATPAQTRAADDFAQILARRLDKSSQFEFRLDPPEMGRVEGRLTLGDDGKAVLALKFDNQAAFDMFARDEQALRQTLANAGFDFSDGDFVFSFRDDAAPELARTDFAPAPAHSLATPAYDAAFAAPWSAGAIDIRI